MPGRCPQTALQSTQECPWSPCTVKFQVVDTCSWALCGQGTHKGQPACRSDTPCVFRLVYARGRYRCKRSASGMLVTLTSSFCYACGLTVSSYSTLSTMPYTLLHPSTGSGSTDPATLHPTTPSASSLPRQQALPLARRLDGLRRALLHQGVVVWIVHGLGSHHLLHDGPCRPGRVWRR